MCLRCLNPPNKNKEELLGLLRHGMKCVSFPPDETQHNWTNHTVCIYHNLEQYINSSDQTHKLCSNVFKISMSSFFLFLTGCPAFLSQQAWHLNDLSFQININNRLKELTQNIKVCSHFIPHFNLMTVFQMPAAMNLHSLAPKPRAVSDTICVYAYTHNFTSSVSSVGQGLIYNVWT